MAYARFSKDSDVYVFLNVGGFLDCCGCSLHKNAKFYSVEELLQHLEVHKQGGDKVPEYCIERLKEDKNFIERSISEWDGEY